MPIYLTPGPSAINPEIAKLYEAAPAVGDTPAIRQIGKVYSFDGTAAHEIYTAELLLYERGTFYNTDVIPILHYRAFDEAQNISLQYYPGNDNYGGIYTRVAPPSGYSKIHFIVRSDLGAGYNSSVQYGQNALTASLPTIGSGAGRISYANADVPGTETELTIDITGAYGFFMACNNWVRSAYVYKIWLK